MVFIEIKALKRTKDLLIYFLRVYFENKKNYECLIPSQVNADYYQQTRIFDTEPEDLRGFPVIIISGSNGTMITSALGDMAQEVYDPHTGELIAYKYGGIYDFNITIEIGCINTIDREIISDLVAKALRYYLRRKIEASGVIIKTMQYGGETTVQYDSKKIYVSTINLSTWSEWYDDIKLLPIDNVDIEIGNVNVNISNDKN